MKLKHTTAKKARRASAWHKNGTYGSPSEKRHLLRDKLPPKTFGCQVVRLQRIVIRGNLRNPQVDEFGNPRIKIIKHAV